MGILEKKAASLLDMLETVQGLGKQASQQIKHMKLTSAQKNLGEEQQVEQQNALPAGVCASNPSDAPAVQVAPRDLQGGVQQSINKDPAKCVGGVTEMSENTKTAALRHKVASIIADKYVAPTATNREDSVESSRIYNRVASKLNQRLLAKHAAVQKVINQPVAPAVEPTGISVMSKFASYMEQPTEAALEEIHRDIRYMSEHNPLFNQACEAAAMRKFAAEADALAASQGISPEQASALLQDSIASDPAAAQELQGEVEGEAMNDLAGAEAGAMEDANIAQQLADAATEQTGVPVSAQDIDAAISEVEAQAEQMGVAPEDLIMAAAQQMQQQAGDAGTDPQAEAMAAQLVDEAAKQGISPEELLAGLSQQLEGQATPEAATPEAATPAEAPEEAPAQDVGQMEPKTACLHRLAGTRRGQQIAARLQRR